MYARDYQWVHTLSQNPSRQGVTKRRYQIRNVPGRVYIHSCGNGLLRLRRKEMLFEMAFFAAGGSFFHFCVALLAFLVGILLAKALNLPALSFLMALFAVLESIGVCLVLERDPFFHLDHVGGEC